MEKQDSGTIADRRSKFNPRFRRFRMAISSLRLAPHLVVMLCMTDKRIVEADLSRWAESKALEKPRTPWDFIVLFVLFMTFTKAYRNVFYLRLGIKSYLLRWLCPSLGSLKIDSGHIGPGLYIVHGENTFVTAESIGANCQIGRHVVMGFANGAVPVVGDNVNILSGAKIIGKVTIGHNATIGLNTVVLHNVEPYTTVLGVPARVECAGPPSALAHLEAGRQSDAPGSGPAIPG